MSNNTAVLFECNICDYTTSRNSQYTRHMSTRKHIQNANCQHLSTFQFHKVPLGFTCECGKKYKERTGLWKHKQKCVTKIMPDKEIPEVENETASILELLKQNQEFKQLMVDQNKQMHETQLQLQQSYNDNTELQNKMVELFKEGKTINNTTNNNNQQFNLNFFLNDTCKDAMNITDFLSNMDVHIDEIEYIGNHGYVNGMTKMIMERLKEMDVTKRPIHCTDIKRETMYIKDKDEWSKDTDELTKVRKILNRISMNNYRTVPAWKNAHPECEVVASRTYDFCYSMMESLLGDVEDEQIKLDNKIIKTLSKVLYCKN